MYGRGRASLVAWWQRIPLQCRSHRRCGFDPWVRKIPLRRACQLTPVYLPGESHGQRSLAGYSPWGCKESDTTEATEHVAQPWSQRVCGAEKDLSCHSLCLKKTLQVQVAGWECLYSKLAQKWASLVAQRVKRSLRYNYLQCHRLSIAKILWEQSETVIFARTLIRLAQDTPDRNDYSLSSRKTRSLSPLRTGRNLRLCFSLGTWM